MKLAALLKRNFLYESFSTKFLRSHSFEVLWEASIERLYKESHDICSANKTFALKKFRKSPLLMLYKIGVLKNFTKSSGKHLCWSHSLMQLQLNFKNDSSQGVFRWINRNFKNVLFTKHLLIRKLQGKQLYRSPVPVSLKEMPCDFIKVVSTRSIFKEILRLCFETDIQQETMRLFIFKIKCRFWTG